MFLAVWEGSTVDWQTADLAEVSQQTLSPLDQELAAILALSRINYCSRERQRY